MKREFYTGSPKAYSVEFHQEADEFWCDMIVVIVFSREVFSAYEFY